MFSIDPLSREPVYSQLISQVETYVLKDILTADSQIPSVRGLSLSLSINPNTIQKAYSELDRNGIIYSVPGKGCFIAKDAKLIINKLRRGDLSEFIQMAEKLALAGIEKEELIECINDVYSKGVLK